MLQPELTVPMARHTQNTELPKGKKLEREANFDYLEHENA
jgi:hypothetical protein